MRWGLVARAEDRGLGILSWEIHRNLRPQRVLVVNMGDLARGFPPHLDRYLGRQVTPFVDGQLDETICRDFLATIDVVLMLETAYDWRMIEWAREMGVRTVLYAMPEFYRSDVPQPDVVWNPTTWRHDTLPSGSRVVPVPVATDRFETPHGRKEGPIRVLHNAGHRAAMDRNGTAIVYSALRFLRTSARVDVRISGQDGRLPTPRRTSGPVRVETVPAGAEHYWDVPVGADILVMPRRYGGLCLPVQEALAAGAVPIMPDVSPNGDWPAVLVPAKVSGEIRTQGGVLPLAAVDPGDLAGAIGRLVDDPDLLAWWRGEALDWADRHSWHALAGLWMAELERAAGG